MLHFFDDVTLFFDVILFLRPFLIARHGVMCVLQILHPCTAVAGLRGLLRDGLLRTRVPEAPLEEAQADLP